MKQVRNDLSGTCVAVRSLDERIKVIEEHMQLGRGSLLVPNSDANDLEIKKCGSSMGKAELVHLFYLLMDEGVWFFDASNAKTNRSRFQDFIFRNFTYSGEGRVQHRIAGVSRHFSECRGYSYRKKQIMYLDRIIKLLTSRKERLENR